MHLGVYRFCRNYLAALIATALVLISLQTLFGFYASQLALAFFPLFVAATLECSAFAWVNRLRRGSMKTWSSVLGMAISVALMAMSLWVLAAHGWPKVPLALGVYPLGHPWFAVASLPIGGVIALRAGYAYGLTTEPRRQQVL